MKTVRYINHHLKVMCISIQAPSQIILIDKYTHNREQDAIMKG